MAQIDLEQMLNFYREYFSSGELQHFLLQSLPLLLRIPSKEFKKKKDLEEVIEVARKGAQPFPFDQNAFDVALRASIKAVFASQSRRNAGSDKQIPKTSAQGKEEDPLGLFLRDYRTGIRKKIEAIPSSLEKAKAGLRALIDIRGEVSYGPAVYEACVLLAHTIEEQRIQDIIADWSKERRSLEERDPTVENLRSRKMFWRLGSQDFTEDGISRYRFREKFDVTGFDSAFEVFESEMSDALCEPVSGSDVHRLAMELSSLSRSRTLVARLRLAVDIGLRRLVESSGTVCWLQPRGLPTEGMVQIPSVATTAYATSALLMLGTSDIQRDVGLRGMRWLLEQQSGDGHWTNDSSSGRSTSGIPDIEITTACINALLKSGLPRISRSLNLAQTWLISQQNALGFWEQRGTDFVLLTVSVLETLERVAKRPSKVAEPLVSAAQGFMKSCLAARL